MFPSSFRIHVCENVSWIVILIDVVIVLKLLVNLVDFRAQLELWCRAPEHYEMQTVN